MQERKASPEHTAGRTREAWTKNRKKRILNLQQLESNF